MKGHQRSEARGSGRSRNDRRTLNRHPAGDALGRWPNKRPAAHRCPVAVWDKAERQRLGRSR